MIVSATLGRPVVVLCSRREVFKACSAIAALRYRCWDSALLARCCIRPNFIRSISRRIRVPHSQPLLFGPIQGSIWIPFRLMIRSVPPWIDRWAHRLMPRCFIDRFRATSHRRDTFCLDWPGRFGSDLLGVNVMTLGEVALREWVARFLRFKRHSSMYAGVV